jgi:hypothetical protein
MMMFTAMNSQQRFDTAPPSELHEMDFYYWQIMLTAQLQMVMECYPIY